MEKILDYKIEVAGSSVNLTILHQSPKVRPFFKTEQIKFGKFKITDRGCLNINEYELFLIGYSEGRTTYSNRPSSANAFRYAAELAEALELMCAEIEKKTIHKIKFATKFEGSSVYLNIKTGQVALTISNYAGWTGYDFATKGTKYMPFKRNEWIVIGDWTSVVTLFGTNLTKENVLAKYNAVEVSGVKQIWHK